MSYNKHVPLNKAPNTDYVCFANPVDYTPVYRVIKEIERIVLDTSYPTIYFSVVNNDGSIDTGHFCNIIDTNGEYVYYREKYFRTREDFKTLHSLLNYYQTLNAIDTLN